MISNLIRKWTLERKLTAYVATLSPEKQARANELRRKLSRATTTETAVIILQNEISEISKKQAKVIEKLAAIKI